MIQEIKKFTLAKHKSKYEKWPKKTKLFFDGSYTGKNISGYVIERQFKVNNCYFLILSYDCPYEETNNFVLLDSSFKILGKKFLGEMYSSYLLEEHKIKSDTVIQLEYYGNICIELNVLTNKRGLFAKNILFSPCEKINNT